MVGKIQILYLCSIVDLPRVVMNGINSLFFKFVWGSSESIKRSILSNDNDKGGFKMLNLNCFWTLGISWLKIMISPRRDT